MELPIPTNFRKCKPQTILSYGTTSHIGIRTLQRLPTNTLRRVETVKACIDAPSKPPKDCIERAIFEQFASWTSEDNKTTVTGGPWSKERKIYGDRHLFLHLINCPESSPVSV